jgi:hypothetical protein
MSSLLVFRSFGVKIKESIGNAASEELTDFMSF